MANYKLTLNYDGSRYKGWQRLPGTDATIQGKINAVLEQFAGYPVEVDGVQVGVVTTGYRSISTDRSVCVAMVDKAYTELGTKVEIRIRKKVFPGIVTKRRFYETNYKK